MECLEVSFGRVLLDSTTSLDPIERFRASKSVLLSSSGRARAGIYRARVEHEQKYFEQVRVSEYLKNILFLLEFDAVMAVSGVLRN